MFYQITNPSSPKPPSGSRRSTGLRRSRPDRKVAGPQQDAGPQLCGPGTLQTGHLKALWLEIFGPGFPLISAETDPWDPFQIAGARPAHQFHRKISSADQFQSRFTGTRKPFHGHPKIKTMGLYVGYAYSLDQYVGVQISEISLGVW